MSQIQVTLTFSSIAAAVSALSRLEPGVAADTVVAGASAPGNAKPNVAFGKIEKVKVEKPEPQAAAQEPAGQAAVASTASSPKPEPEAAATLDYEKDVKPLILKVGATKGRDAVGKIMAELGVAKGPELKPEQLPAAKAALEAALEAALAA